MAAGAVAGLVSSSIDLVDTIVGGAFDMASLNKQQQLEYQQFLAQTFPEYKEFFVFDNSTDYRNIYIIAGMVLLITILIIAITLKDKNSNEEK